VALASLAVAPLVAGGKGSVTGTYAEARTAEVFAGRCVMKSEAGTSGRQAVLAWKVDRAASNGVSLDDLSVVAAVAGDQNWASRRSAARSRLQRPPSTSTSARPARSRWRSSQWPRALARRRRQRRPDHAGTDSVHRGSRRDSRPPPARSPLDVSKHIDHDPSCGAMQWFNPLSSVSKATMGTDRQAHVQRIALSSDLTRVAFLARSARNRVHVRCRSCPSWPC